MRQYQIKGTVGAYTVHSAEIPVGAQLIPFYSRKSALRGIARLVVVNKEIGQREAASRAMRKFMP